MNPLHEDYTFNASALGLGGVLQQGKRKFIIPSQASVALAPTGGEGYSSVENFSCRGISCTRAETRVAGYPARSNYFTTYSDIFISNLSIFDRFRVALMHLSVASSRDTDRDEAHFSMHAFYRGVEVDGVEVLPELDIDLCINSNYEKLSKALASGKETGGVGNDDSIGNDNEVRAQDVKLTTGLARREPIRSSVIRSLELRKRDQPHLVERTPGNVLEIEDFGKIWFGELLVKPGRRRVNLLRFSFDKLAKFDQDEAADADQRMMFAQALETDGSGGGTLTVGSGDGNGAPVWPRG